MRRAVGSRCDHVQRSARTASRPTASARSRCRPIATGARRPSAACRTSASAARPCRRRWSARSASSSRRRRGSTASSARSSRASPSRSSAPPQEVIDGKLADHFPLVVWQTGSGTQSNMNANEVIANRANEMLGAPLGSKSPVHPNDHVNRGQSSNDTFPTAMHIAAVEQVQHQLLPALEHLPPACTPRPRRSRTSSRSAAPICRTRPRSRSARSSRATSSRSATASRGSRQTLPRLYELAQGGTAVGTGLNAHAGLRRALRRGGRGDHRPAVRHRAEQVRGAGRGRRAGRAVGRAQRGRGQPDQDRQRHPAARLRPALRLRRAEAARERARLLDHAGQGQPDPVRGADHGLRPGHGQPRHGHASPAPAATSSSTSTSR